LWVLACSKVRFFYGGTNPGYFFNDVQKYFTYGSRAIFGEVPFRDYLIEYPLLSFPIFVAPRLLTTRFEVYRVLFALEMMAFSLLTLLLIAGWVSRSERRENVPRHLVWYTLFFTAMSPLTIARFDVAAAAVAFAGWTLWANGARTRGGAILGLGALLKVFPMVLVIPALIREKMRFGGARGTGLIAFLATVTAGFFIWTRLAETGLRESIQYHLNRPIEIESLYAGFVYLLARVTGSEITHYYDYSSEVLWTAYSSTLGALALPFQMTVLLLVFYKFWRSGGNQAMRYAAGAVLAYIAFGKVLSPQYLIWLFPFVAAMEGRTGRVARPVFLVACLLTTAVYPFAFTALVYLNPWAFALLNLRNLVLVALLGFLLFARDAR
jgi:hypothetical protein